MSLSCNRAARVVTSILQCSLRTSQGASAQLTHVGIGTAERVGMLGSNCKVWDLSPTSEVWDSLGIISSNDYIIYIDNKNYFVPIFSLVDKEGVICLPLCVPKLFHSQVEFGEAGSRGLF